MSVYLEQQPPETRPHIEGPVAELLKARERADQALIAIARDYNQWTLEQKEAIVEYEGGYEGREQRNWKPESYRETYRTPDGRIETVMYTAENEVYIIEVRIGQCILAKGERKYNGSLTFYLPNIEDTKLFLGRAYIQYWSAESREIHYAPSAYGVRGSKAQSRIGAGDPLTKGASFIQTLRESEYVGSSPYPQTVSPYPSFRPGKMIKLGSSQTDSSQ